MNPNNAAPRKAPRQPAKVWISSRLAGRGGAAEHAGESVDGKGAAHALVRNALRQQGVVGGVIDRVGQAGDAEHGDEDPK